jgi:hypothetical protein
MAKQYFQGKAGFDMLVKKKPALKIIIPSLNAFAEVTYLETDDGKITGGFPMLKIVDSKSFGDAITVLSSIKNVKVTDQKNNKFLIEAGTDKVNLYKSGGGYQNVIDQEGNAVTSKSPSTAQQEDGTRFCLEYYSINKIHPDKDLINKTVKFNFGKDWHDSFEKTVTAVLTVISKSSMGQYDFYRDSNPKKPKFLNQITDSKVLPDSKDNWNPSDIWLVKKTSAQKLGLAVDILYKKLLTKEAGIEDLNKFVEEKFNSKEIIGISLKKVAAPKATISKIEVDANYIKSIRYIGPWKQFDYKVSNSYFDILPQFKVFKDSVNYRFRFRPRGASNELNTYGEGQPENAKVFDGAISRDMLNAEFPGMLTVISDMKKADKVEANVSAQINSMASLAVYKKFAAYVSANKFKFVTVSGINDKMPEYEVKRSVVLLYYIYSLETATNPAKIYKNMYLAAKKMNDFSSIHYKVY